MDIVPVGMPIARAESSGGRDALEPRPDYLHPARVDTYGSSGLLLVSANPSGRTAV
jgi:hypothetical protein